jgi:hypothetical protein
MNYLDSHIPYGYADQLAVEFMVWTTWTGNYFELGAQLMSRSLTKEERQEFRRRWKRRGSCIDDANDRIASVDRGFAHATEMRKKIAPFLSTFQWPTK